MKNDNLYLNFIFIAVIMALNKQTDRRYVNLYLIYLAR